MGRRNQDYPARASDLKLAPGDLRFVQALVNSRDLEAGTDELKSPRALSDWLTRVGLVTHRIELGAVELEVVIAVREASRPCGSSDEGGSETNRCDYS